MDLISFACKFNNESIPQMIKNFFDESFALYHTIKLYDIEEIIIDPSLSVARYDIKFMPTVPVDMNELKRLIDNISLRFYEMTFVVDVIDTSVANMITLIIRKER